MKERTIAAVAWRNLWRNRRRTIITLSSIAFGILLSVLFTGLGDRTYGEMIDLAARMGGGHVTIQDKTYQDNPSLKKTVQNISEKMAAAKKIDGVVTAVPRIAGYTMLATARESLGAFFVGIDPAMEDKSTFFALKAIESGTIFKKDDKDAMLLGKKLAEQLDITLGSKVVYTLTDKNGEMVTGLGRVSGIIHTGSDAFDGGFCLLPIETVRKVLGYDKDEATQAAIFVKDKRDVDRIAGALQAELSGTDTAAPWYKTQPDLAGFISMKQSGAAFMEIIIMVLIAAGIFNTLFVSVMERMREFGIMTAVGFAPSQLFRMVMWESLWLSLVGLIVGAAVTAWPYRYLSTKGLDFSSMVGDRGTEVAGVVVEPIMRVGIFFEHGVIIAAAVVAATLLSGLYPAWRAGRVAPVESIKLV